MTAVELHDRAYAALGVDIRGRDLVALTLQRERVAAAVIAANRQRWQEAARELRVAADLEGCEPARARALARLADEADAVTGAPRVAA